MKKISANIKKIAAAAMLAAAPFLAIQTKAMAYEGDPWFHAWEAAEWVEFLNEYAAFVEEVDNQFFNINMYLAQTYSYLTAGEGDTGKGVIGTMNKIWAEERPFLEAIGNNGASWQKANALDMLPGQVAMQRAGDPRNCSEIPTRIGARAAGGSRGGSRAIGSRVDRAIQAASVGTKISESSYASEINATHGSADLGLCAKEDVSFDANGDAAKAYGSSRNLNGCQAAGPMPNGDIRGQSLFVPAYDYVKVADGDAGELAKASSLTFNPKQSTVAGIAAKNIVASFSAPAMPKDVEASPAGQLVTAKGKILQARLSPAIQALASIASFRAPAALGSKAADALSNNWMSTATPVYGRVFPAGTEVPKVPSLAEILRFEVFRRYMDFGGDQDSWLAQLNDSQDPARVGRMQAETQAVQLYVEYEILNRLEENNAIQAAILSQLVNPVSKQEVVNASAAAYKASK